MSVADSGFLEGVTNLKRGGVGQSIILTIFPQSA